MSDHGTRSGRDAEEPRTGSPVTSRRTVLRALTVIPAGIGLVSGGMLAAAADPTTRVLRAGMAGTDVRELQVRVAGWAADEPRQTLLTITGTFDAATEAAVRRFQRANGLPVSGVADRETNDRLAALESSDGSTAHFEWAQFGSPGDASVRDRVRQLMYKLEALRHKAAGREVGVLAGYREPAEQVRLGASAASAHPLGGAADITVVGLSTYAVYRIAQTCGFSGLGSYTQSWLHCDTRAELGGPPTWFWHNGIVR